MQLFAILALSILYSRIVLKKIPRDALNNFRSVEKSLKKYGKLKADIIYLNALSNNN